MRPGRRKASADRRNASCAQPRGNLQPVVWETVTTQTLRGVCDGIVATARLLPKRRIAAAAAAVAVLAAVALTVPVPTAVQLRDWAAAAGPWFPLAFLAAHGVVTVFPFPRTAFTLAAGLLFGPALGAALAVTASTVSALIALWLVRAVGLQLNRFVRHPRVGSLDARLHRRGWTAILSLRLIPAMPFAVLNYAAGASAVRAWPYAIATLAGLVPGTVAVVVLGDALTGDVSPLLFLVSLVTAAAGVALLVYEVRLHRQHRPSLVAEGGAPYADAGGPAR